MKYNKIQDVCFAAFSDRRPIKVTDIALINGEERASVKASDGGTMIKASFASVPAGNYKLEITTAEGVETKENGVIITESVVNIYTGKVGNIAIVTNL